MRDRPNVACPGSYIDDTWRRFVCRLIGRHFCAITDRKWPIPGTDGYENSITERAKKPLRQSLWKIGFPVAQSSFSRRSPVRSPKSVTIRLLNGFLTGGTEERKQLRYLDRGSDTSKST